MCHDAKKLVDARPGDGPWNRALGQLRHQRSSDPVLRQRDDLRLDENFGVGAQSTTVHQIEQLVAIEQVDSRPRFRLPSSKHELDSLSGRLWRKCLLQQLICDFLKRAAFASGLLLDAFQDIVIDRQRRARHASKCMGHTS